MRASKEMIEPLVDKKISELKSHVDLIRSIKDIQVNSYSKFDVLDWIEKRIIELKAYRAEYAQAPEKTVLEN
jgi:hypothetical protein